LTRVAITVAIVLAAGAMGCGDKDPSAPRPGDGGSGDHRGNEAAPDGDAGGGGPAWLERLDRPEDFAGLQGEGWSVKYLGAVAGRTPPAALDRPCTFQNTARFPLHLQFLHSFPELTNLDFATYLNLTQRAASRVWWAGELQLVPGGKHPRTGAPGLMAVFVYADANDPVGVDDLVAIDQRLKSCAPYARDLMVLVAADPDQNRDFLAKAPMLNARGVDVADLEKLRPVVGAEGYSLGEAYGYLRVVPRGTRPLEAGPRDILVSEGSFEDLGLVAGLVTALPQNLHSHVNLRLREKGIPNARIPDVYDNQAVLLLSGKLAHLTVAETQARLEPATLEDAEAFWKQHRPPARPLRANLEETRLRDFTVVAASEAIAYGVKAANLGELYRVLPPANRAPGFAIPFSVHRDFLAASGLDARVAAFVADPVVRTDTAARRRGLKQLRDAIEAAPLPAGLLDRLVVAARAAFGDGHAGAPTRFRSSSNAEDGELVSGAGLHDSARGCFVDDSDGDDVGPSACLSAEEATRLRAELDRRRAELAANPQRIWLVEVIDDLDSDLTRERTVARALRRVYASLWNERAFEEREYWSMDHRQAFMGVAVNPSFVLEQLDAVAVTNVPVAGGAPIYRVVSQRDGQPVVRPPDPTLVAETLTFNRGPGDMPTGVQVLTRSSLSPDPLWTDARLGELARLMFVVQDHFGQKVYPEATNLSLDLEIKVTREGQLVIKQARPYRVP
jgi:pyruvate, water dikinase